MKVKNSLAMQEKRVRDWRIVSGILLLIVLYLGHALKTTVNELTIHIPPNLSSGATLATGEIPKPNIYTFSHYLFQQLSTWESDGAEDGPNNLDNYKYYMTDDFFKYAKQVHAARTQKGETKGRTRAVREATQKGYDSSKVVQISDTKWVVKLDMLVVEKIGDTEVKRVAVRYPVVVILDNTHPQYNPWGFKFAGYDSEPRKILIKGG